MKLEVTENMMQTNVRVKSNEFKIGNMSVIIDILRSKLYSNHTQTMVQEYLCNARDAMREVNSKKTIDITLPTRLESTFKVRDFGPGISPERMNGVFIEYGSSSKRDSNKETGGYGIGSKIAFGYTDSFTVTTFIDGVKRVYSAHIGNNSNGSCDLLSTSKTTEANGTEIAIAIDQNDIAKITQAAFKTTYFWKQKVNYIGVNQMSEVPKRVPGVQIGNLEATNAITRWELPNFAQRGNLAIVDGIPYDLDKFVLTNTDLKRLYQLFSGNIWLYIPNGAIQVAASREALDDKPATHDYLTKVAQKLIKETQQHLNEQFKGIRSPHRHLEVYKECYPFFELNKFAKFKHFNISNDKLFSEKFLDVKMFQVTYNSFSDSLSKHEMNKSRSVWRSKRNCDLTTKMLDHLFFNDGTEAMVRLNRRIRGHMKDSGIKQLVYFELSPSKKISADSLLILKSDLKLKDLLKLELPKPVRKERVKRTIDKTKLCLHVWQYYGRSTEYITTAENTKKWIYAPMTKGSFLGGLQNYDLKELANYFNNYNLCGISEKSVHLIKDDPNFTHIADYLKDLKPSNKEFGAVKSEKAINIEVIEKLKNIDGLKDKDVSKIVAEYNYFRGISQLPRILFTTIAMMKEIEAFTNLDKKVKESMHNKYSLIQDLSTSRHKDDIVFYMNTKFNKRGA